MPCRLLLTLTSLVLRICELFVPSFPSVLNTLRWSIKQFIKPGTKQALLRYFEEDSVSGEQTATLLGQQSLWLGSKISSGAGNSALCLFGRRMTIILQLTFIQNRQLNAQKKILRNSSRGKMNATASTCAAIGFSNWLEKELPSPSLANFCCPIMRSPCKL